MWIHIFQRDNGKWLDSVPELLIDQWLEAHPEFKENVILLWTEQPGTEMADLIAKLRAQNIIEFPRKPKSKPNGETT